MGSKSRRKGHDFERRIVRCIKHLWPSAKRGFQSREGANEQCDVEGTPFHIECKRHKKVNVAKEMDGAMEKRPESDTRPLALVHQDDYGRILVTFDFDEWLKLVEDTS